MDSRTHKNRVPKHPLSAEELESLLAIADDAIIVTDASQRILLFNHGAERMFGYSAQETLGQSLDMLLPLPTRQVHQQYITSFGTSGPNSRRMGERGEIAGRRKDGTVFPAEASISRFGGDDDLIFTAIVRDTTERRRRDELLRAAKEAAEAANNAKSMFLANMSHEIRTPLNAVIGMTSLLLETRLAPEQKEYAHTIRSSSEALLAIINDILDFSKIELGKLELERQPFDLRRCVEISLDLVASAAADKNLNLAYLIDDGVPAYIVSDVTRLRQVLVNLLSNAVKFTSHGEVYVSVEATALSDDDFELHFAVKDTGIGIPANRMDQLFRSFSQLDASTTRKYGGTGLGLAISKRLAEIMGGKMWVESEVGKGSIFHFTIHAASAGHDLARSYLQERSRGLTGKRVLIVDDNTTNRRILVKQTLLWGMLPSAVASGIEALDLVRHGHAFDVAILDMSMPEMDGLGLAFEIRELRDAAALPLVMLSSMSQRVDAEGMERAQFAAYLTKPIKSSQLFNALSDALHVESLAPVESDSEATADAEMANHYPLFILVAEDNTVNQRVMQRLLGWFGYRADIAANGVEVLEALDRQNYDLILMDVQMPEMDGLEATRRIAQRFPQGKRPRIVAMTADVMPGDRELCLAAGMDDYVPKPVELADLRQVLSRAASGSPPPETLGQVSDIARLNGAKLNGLRMLDREAGPRLIGELLDMFKTEAPNQIAQMESAVAKGDATLLYRTAHSFLSSLYPLGLDRMAALCKDLERVGRSGSIAGAAPLVEALKGEYDASLQALSAEIAKGSG